MNSSYGSFDFTGGWQDDEFVGSPGSGRGGLYPCRANQYNYPHAQQVAANAAPTENDETTTARPHWSAAFDALSFNSHYGGYYCGSEPYLSTSLPACTPSGLLHWDDGTGVAQLSDFDPPPSSLSGSDMDYFHTYPTVPAELHSQSLPLLPAFPFAITQLPIHPAQPQHILRAQPTLPSPALPSPTTADTSNDPTTTPTTLPATTFLPPNLSDPPTPPSYPPPTTLSPTDPLRPRSQPLRFVHDLYTPTFVRGEGPTRSGWCGHCASWLTLKDSAYWYHMHFAHGISCATGGRLERPVNLRVGSGSGSCSGAAHGRGSDVGNGAGVAPGAGRGTGRAGGGDWEALCGHCHRWVLLVSGEKGRTAWFRHAYKCQLKGGVHPGAGTGAGTGGRQRAVRGVGAGSGGGSAKSRSSRKVAVRPAL